jgi:hypothetical protein
MLEKPTSDADRASGTYWEYRVVRRYGDGKDLAESATWLEITRCFFRKGTCWTYDDQQGPVSGGGSGEPDAACLRNMSHQLRDYQRALDLPILDQKADFKAPLGKPKE